MNTDTLSKWSPYALGALRVMAGLLLMQHGMQKYFHFPPGGHVAGPVEVFSLFGIGGAIELVGGGLLAIGLFARPVAFVLAGQMAVAYFLFHFPRVFTTEGGFFPVVNEGDLAVLFCFVFLYLFFEGPGAMCLDRGRTGGIDSTP